MNGTTVIREPLACNEVALRKFASLVRQGFDPVREPLDGRIRDAKWLAFHYATDDTLAAIAAIKAPHEQYRRDLFEKADARISATDYRLELGWVFVIPAHRRNRMADSLCRLLLQRVPLSYLFATTRPNNDAMIKILRRHGFVRAGRPYPRRNEELVLFLRPSHVEDQPNWPVIEG